MGCRCPHGGVEETEPVHPWSPPSAPQWPWGRDREEMLQLGMEVPLESPEARSSWAAPQQEAGRRGTQPTGVGGGVRTYSCRERWVPLEGWMDTSGAVRASVCVCTHGVCAHTCTCVCTWGVCVHRCVPVHILCHVHVCARVFVCTHGCVHTRLCMHVCARGSVCVRACVHISVCACVSSRVCAWRLYADACACMCKLRLCVHRHLSLYSHWRVCSHTCLRSHTRVSV